MSRGEDSCRCISCAYYISCTPYWCIITIGAIYLLSNRGNVLGGSSVVVTGPCFDDYKQVFCHFEDLLGGVSPEAIVLGDRRALCVVPPLRSVGRSTFKLHLVDHTDGEMDSQERHFFSRKSSIDNIIACTNVEKSCIAWNSLI